MIIVAVPTCIFFLLYLLSFFHKKRYKPMVDCGCKKIQVKGDRRRSDGGKTRDRRGTDGETDEDQTKGEDGRKARRRQGEINKAALNAALFYGDPCNLWEIDYLNCSQNVVLFWLSLVSLADAG